MRRRTPFARMDLADLGILAMRIRTGMVAALLVGVGVIIGRLL